LFIYLLLPYIFRAFFSPSSEAGVQLRQWFKSPGYGVSARSRMGLYSFILARAMFMLCLIPRLITRGIYLIALACTLHLNSSSRRQIKIFWNVWLCLLVSISCPVEELAASTFWVHYVTLDYCTLKTEGIQSSEMSVIIHESIRRKIVEDLNLYQHRCANLISPSNA
jgi:hypothetical protein